MKISVEMSMYPLHIDYEVYILEFLENLNKYSDVEVRTNGMSTQLFGEYDYLMDVLKKEIKAAFEQKVSISMVMKILNLDASGFDSSKN